MEYNIKNITDLTQITEIRNNDVFLVGRNSNSYYSTFSTTFDNLSSQISEEVKTTLKDAYTDIGQLSDDIQTRGSEYHNHFIDAYVAKQIIDRTDALMSLSSVLMGTVYPVGSIYTTTDVRNPKEILGWSESSWKKVRSGHFLMCSDDSNSNISTYVEQGLPDPKITVKSTMADGGEHTHSYESTTVKVTPESSWGGTPVAQICECGNKDGKHTHNITNTVSYGNAIYGKTDSVQPKAFCVNMWERIG